ncbi:MAG TPA: adenylosuccinate synthetase [Myxococcaceae bacterium]|nr:adenylosuccinate synthetase [Myxococcaceae bacterium]
MLKRIVVLSGPVVAGKSTLARTLASQYGFTRLSTRQLIEEELGVEAERRSLQRAGEDLDKKTGGRWVCTGLTKFASKLPPDSEVIVDSARIEPQIDALREAFGARVVHVHITAVPELLRIRYKEREGEIKEVADYDEVRASPTESNIDALAAIADVVIDTGRTGKEDAVVVVASRLGLYGRSVERLVDVLIGGQYGSEGKGNVCSYLAREYALLVRVGGPNAGHMVYAEPESYTFKHLPSGTKHSEARLILGPGAVLRVPTLLEEIARFEVSAQRLSIDPRAMIIEDVDVKREESLKKSIGSTGQGVGQATARKVLREAAEPKVRLASESRELKPYIRETLPILEGAYAQGQRIFLEGTQGTGLSLHHGAYPFVTSRETTVGGCLGEAGIAPSRVRKIIMVCRTYPIRVQSPSGGTSGPMSGELTWEEVSRRSGLPLEKLLQAEKGSISKRQRRVGEFDWTLLRRGASLNGPTDVALTFVDYLSAKNREARRFEQLSEETIRFIEEVEQVAAAPVSLVSTRFHHRCIIDRRAW